MVDYEQRDRILQELGFNSYELYLLSPLWKSIRLKQFCRHNKCLICNGKAEVVHHTTYRKKVLEGKSHAGLVSLCHACHQLIEIAENGWKRTLKSSNEKLRELTHKKVAYHKDKKKQKQSTKVQYKCLKQPHDVKCMKCEEIFETTYKMKHTKCLKCGASGSDLVVWCDKFEKRHQDYFIQSGVVRCKKGPRGNRDWKAIAERTKQSISNTKKAMVSSKGRSLKQILHSSRVT